jgi:hypothetical protein
VTLGYISLLSCVILLRYSLSYHDQRIVPMLSMFLSLSSRKVQAGKVDIT